MPRRQGLARAPHLSERRRNLAEGMLQEPASLHLWISGYADRCKTSSIDHSIGAKVLVGCCSTGAVVAQRARGSKKEE